jgi:predicted dehydrogenase
MSAPRVALVGPRRRRQGLGPFVARHLVEAGAEVPCLLGTREDTVRAAARDLAPTLGREPRGYASLDAMLASEELDALAILSPIETHERFLEAALARGLHCLCEKPLVWGPGDPAAAARRLVEAFGRSGLRLWENCQWPYVLDAFERLHPGFRRATVRRFEMRLSPTSRGFTMLVDSLSHPLSLLQALAPAEKARVGAERFESADGGRRARVAFTWPADAGPVAVEVRLEQQLEPPRIAELAVDGHRARREIREPGYRTFLCSEAREVPAPDPTARLVADFVRDLGGGPVPAVPAADPSALVQRMEVLAQILAACGSPEGRP